MPKLTFHLIPNAHLDPVWLWDWREGLNEGLITCRTILDLMDERPELTFIRGEAVIYQHIERTDPATFARIAKYVKQGRWDVVGGTHIQPDTNLPATETFARHFERAGNYFREKFGKTPRIAWAADSFGHSGGLPAILASAGIKGYAFTRPEPRIVPIAKPAFWWRSPGGHRVLAYRPPAGWYGNERIDVKDRLDQLLQAAQKSNLQNVGCFFGLGNHGGGPTRRHLDDIDAWIAAHPEVRVIYSGLHRFFDALFAEARKNGDGFFPTHDGELNFCLRGCYGSVAKFKFAYRHAEAAVSRAETVGAAIASATNTPAVDLSVAWDAVLFNSFHDILPGSSIERAFDDQLAWIGSARHASQVAELAALNALALRIDTRVAKVAGDHPSAVAMLVFNPHPYPYAGEVEIEASLDYRPIYSYHNRVNELPLRLLDAERRPLPFQRIHTEHTSMKWWPWRARVLAPVKLPAMGWSVLEYGWVEGESEPTPPANPATVPEPGVIDNGIYRVSAALDDYTLHISHHGQSIFGQDGLSAAVFEDPFGSWGGMNEEPESIDISTVRETFRISHIQMLENGPRRATMLVILGGNNSRLELTISLVADRDAVDISARLFWNERSARLKLTFPVGDQAEFDVPGGVVGRGVNGETGTGEVPGGRWVRVHGPRGSFGFASDGLYNFDLKPGLLRATVARATRYANDDKTGPTEERHLPAVDSGELKFKFLINSGDENLPRLARELEQPPMVLLVAPNKGKLPRAGSLAELKPESLKLLALHSDEDGKGVILRLQETAGRATVPVLNWLGKKVKLDKLPAHWIATWRLKRTKLVWKAKREG